MIEIWRPIPGYEEYYEVSSLGRVRRIKGGANTHVGRILKGKLRADGYLSICLSSNGICKEFSIHRLVCSAFHENTENKPCVNHIDGNKTNNCAENLEWCTYQENAQHALRTGLYEHCTGYHHTEESRRKMSESHRGKHLSEETRRKMSESRKGRQFSEETRRKISEAHKGKKRPDLMGHEVSQETRRKISEAQLRRWQRQKEAAV